MAAIAKEIGVPNFPSLLKAYSQAMVSNKPTYTVSAVTEFPGQPLELECGNYICNESGVSIESAFGGFITVCAHPIMPVKRLINIDTGEVKLEIAYLRSEDEGWRRSVFGKDKLANARSIIELAQVGISVTSESAKDLVKFIAAIEDMNYDRMPVEKTVDHLGWVDGIGFSPYVEHLAYDNGGKFENEFRCIKAVGSADKWFELARQVRSGNNVQARIVLAASFASVLIKKVSALPFIVHIWGSVSGVGKSVAMMLAASVWGKPDIDGGYVKQLNGTMVGIEQSAAFCGNIPLFMDELQLIQENRKNFDGLIYMLCEGNTKPRGARSGGLQRGLTWRNVIITNGEQPITSANSRSGALSRVIEVECSEKPFDDPRKVALTIQENYGHSGRMFVERLQADDAMQNMMDAHAYYYDQLKEMSTDKQILSASIILAADHMADLLLFNDGRVLTVEEIMPFLVARDVADINRTAYEWLMDWAAQNQNKFVPINNDTYQGECWGRYENAKGKRCAEDQEPYMLCVIKNVFYNAMTMHGYNPKAFLSWADKKELIQREGKHLDRKVRLTGGVRPRCICIRMNAFDDGFTEVSIPDEEFPF